MCCIAKRVFRSHVLLKVLLPTGSSCERMSRAHDQSDFTSMCCNHEVMPGSFEAWSLLVRICAVIVKGVRRFAARFSRFKRLSVLVIS